MSEVDSSKQPSSGSYARLSVNINDQTAADLRRLAARDGVSITELIRRAVSVLDFVEGEIAKGNEIQLVDKRRGTVTDVVFFDSATDKNQELSPGSAALSSDETPAEREVIRIGPALPAPRKPFWLSVQMFVASIFPRIDYVGHMYVPLPHPERSARYRAQAAAWNESQNTSG